MAKPFLKWVGSKRQLLPELIKHVPAKYGAYHEPFLGGGSLFFEVQPRWAILSDSNRCLITTYQAVTKHPKDVIKGLAKLDRRWRSCVSDVDRRKLYDESVDSMTILGRECCSQSKIIVACAFIFLNKTGFNGLFRVNKSGRFNVPMGRWNVPPKICDEDTIKSCAEALRSTLVLRRDFSVMETCAERGDLVYFDPPYWPKSKTANFTGYTSGGFTAADHERLRDVALRLKQEGVHVLLSNADVPEVRKLYKKGFEMRTVSAPRSFNCKGEGRGKVSELLIW